MKLLTRYITVGLLLVLFTSFRGDDDPDKRNAMVNFLFEYLDLKYKGHQINDIVYVAAKRQRLYLIRDKKVIARYPVSTATNGVGNEAHSEKTPLGLHTINSKFGDNVPEGGIMKERRFTGRVAPIITDPVDVEADDITTRILWLSGEEQGVNKGEPAIDSRKRCIYIHGTPEEGLIGKPASHGCIRMKNSDVIELFNDVGVGMHVIILDN